MAEVQKAGPTTYQVDHNKLKPRILAVKFDPAKEKKSWRPVKTKAPDCATYEYGKSKDYCGRSAFIHKFAAPRDSDAASKQSKETFTTLATR